MPLPYVLLPLAGSLSQCDWTIQGIEAHLRQRLPRSWHRIPALMARTLIAAHPGATAPDPARIARTLQESPHAARLLAFAGKSRSLPRPWLDPPVFRPIPALADLPLPPLTTPDDLADWLALPPDQLIRFTDPLGLSARNPVSFARHYHCHLTPKRDGQLRLIEEPKPVLKRLQRRILHGLLDHVPAHPAAHGFVRGRSCIQAAAKHAGEAMVLSFDLADFFPVIAVTRVYAIFRSLGYPAAVARALAHLTTALTPHDTLQAPALAARDPLKARHLPQGAPTSPALANLAAFRLDQRLSGLARSLDATYTRYADDLTFSGDRRIVPILRAALPQITAEEGFRLNPAKTRAATGSQRQTVTGIVVNSHVNLPRADYDLLKATIHHLSRPDDPRRTDPAFLARLQGQIAWLTQVNPARGQKLHLRLALALA